MRRNLTLFTCVVLLHLGALWALQAGLLRRVSEHIVPAQVLMVVSPPDSHELSQAQPQPQPTPSIAPKALSALAIRTKNAVAYTAPEVPQEAPIPAASVAPAETVAAPATSAPQPTEIQEPAVSASSNLPAPMAPAHTPPKVELPSSDAAYLNNPKPRYPSQSRTLNEQGTTTIRVLVGIDGHPQQVLLHQSAGFTRLDQAALDTVRGWTFVPGKRAAVPEPMWVEIPVPFRLTN